jgi:hypothetical protein
MNALYPMVEDRALAYLGEGARLIDIMQLSEGVPRWSVTVSPQEGGYRVLEESVEEEVDA